MLKILFWVLLLGNGALFAYHQGYLAPWIPSGREPARLARQLNADRIKLLPANTVIKPPADQHATPADPQAAQAPAATQPAPEAPAAEVATAAGPAPAAGQAPASQAGVTAPPVVACTEIGNFSEADASRFETQLASLAQRPTWSRQVLRESGSYIVFIPPQGSKENADKKIGQLRRLGVTDFYLLNGEADLPWGISLGLFHTEAAAKARLAQLNQQGVRSAMIGPRNSAPKVVLRLRDLDAATRSRVAAIAADYPQQSLRACR